MEFGAGRLENSTTMRPRCTASFCTLRTIFKCEPRHVDIDKQDIRILIINLASAPLGCSLHNFIAVLVEHIDRDHRADDIVVDEHDLGICFAITRLFC